MDKEKIELRQQIFEIENNAKQFLDGNALSRYGNIKLADSEKALQIALLINQAIQQGQLKEKLDDTQFKTLLMNLQEPKKEFNFVRK
mgnify:CR=1 FL=1